MELTFAPTSESVDFGFAAKENFAADEIQLQNR